MLPLTRFDTPGPDEDRIIDEIIRLNLDDLRRSQPEGLVLRGAHPKTTALLEGALEVCADLPPFLHTSLFVPGNTYAAEIRLSNASPRIQSDSVPDIRGFAMKLYGVQGPRILDDGLNIQDLILVSLPVHLPVSLDDWLSAARATYQSSALPLPVRFLLGRRSRFLLGLMRSGVCPSSPLEQTYGSFAPFLYRSDQVCKFRLRPRSLYQSLRPASLGAQYLTDATAAHLREHPAHFELQVQLRTDPAMPVEAPVAFWDGAPFHTVAHLRIPPQCFRSKEYQTQAEHMRFTPVRGVRDHQPVGAINRLRARLYEKTAHHRLTQNTGCPFHGVG